MNKFYVFILLITLLDAVLMMWVSAATEELQCPEPQHVYSQEQWRTYWENCEMSIRSTMYLTYAFSLNIILALIYRAVFPDER